MPTTEHYLLPQHDVSQLQQRGSPLVHQREKPEDADTTGGELMTCLEEPEPLEYRQSTAGATAPDSK